MCVGMYVGCVSVCVCVAVQVCECVGVGGCVGVRRRVCVGRGRVCLYVCIHTCVFRCVSDATVRYRPQASNTTESPVSEEKIRTPHPPQQKTSSEPLDQPRCMPPQSSDRAAS